MFLGGKTFPSGKLKSSKWQLYINDIVEFIQVEYITKVLFEIDAEAFFQIISILFMEGMPFNFLKMGRDEKKVVDSARSPNHLELLGSLWRLSFEAQPPQHLFYRKEEKGFKNQQEAEQERQRERELHFKHNYKLQFLFFAGNIAAKSSIELNKEHYLKIVIELLTHHQKFLEFNDHLLKRGVEKGGLMRKLSYKIAMKIDDNAKYFYKTQDDLKSLILKSEPLNMQEIQNLQKCADFTNL